MKLEGFVGTELRAVSKVTRHTVTVGNLKAARIFIEAALCQTCRRMGSAASEIGFALMTVVATPEVALSIVAEK